MMPSQTRGAQVERAHGREAHLDGAGSARRLGKPLHDDRLGHAREVARLPGEVEPRPADELVGLGGDRQVGVQRVQFARHVARSDQAVDAVGVAAVVHDPRRQHLVAESRPAGLAAARIGHVGRLAHVVHADLAGRRAHDDVEGRVAGDHRVLLRARRQGRGDDGRRHQHPALRAECAPGGREQMHGARRVDPHADTREQLERRRADRRDGLRRPEVGGAGVCGRAIHRRRESIQSGLRAFPHRIGDGT